MNSTKTRFEKIHASISALLQRAEIPQHIIDLLVNKDTLPCYNCALTHESFDPSLNYDFYEFLGDNIINLAVAEYVTDHFSLTTAGQATIIKHRVQSNKLLG